MRFRLTAPAGVIFLLTFTLNAALRAQVPSAAHVVIILEENHSYESAGENITIH